MKKPGFSGFGRSCMVVAHRGFSAVAPENTLASIRKAVEVGAGGCEFDVRRCVDGTIVAIHDSTLERTTNVSGKVADLRYDQLRDLDAGSWKGAQFAGEKVPTLEQALSALRDTGCHAVIEIKDEGLAEQIVGTVERMRMTEQVFLISFSKETISRITSLDHNIKSVLLYDQRSEQGSTALPAPTSLPTLPDLILSDVRDCRTDIAGLHWSDLSRDLIEKLKSEGLAVWAWTVNDPAVMARLIDWGIDTIITDHPNLLC